MKNSNFYEVLREEVRKDLRREFEEQDSLDFRRHVDPSWSAARSQHERLGTWLATHLEQTQFAAHQRRNRDAELRRYRTQSPRKSSTEKNNRDATDMPSETFDSVQSAVASKEQGGSACAQTPAAERIFQVKTLEQLCALELLNRHGARLPEAFTAADLKTAWRRAALSTHPDRWTDADSKESATQNNQINKIERNALFVAIKMAHETLMRLVTLD